MSIIHDALKKVQQGLASKNEVTQEPPPTAKANNSSYIYNDPIPVETLPPREQEPSRQQAPVPNRIKSLLALTCAIAITVGSGFYIYQEFQNYIPRAQKFAKSSFYKLIHKKEIPDFKTKAPQDLKPMAQLTINPVTSKLVISPQVTVPVTLSVHGIMSNASGNLVLINDQVYQEGDEVDGAKIVKINLSSITVIINGTEQTIQVKS